MTTPSQREPSLLRPGCGPAGLMAIISDRTSENRAPGAAAQVTMKGARASSAGLATGRGRYLERQEGQRNLNSAPDCRADPAR
jgi:hypothetical protein